MCGLVYLELRDRNNCDEWSKFKGGKRKRFRNSCRSCRTLTGSAGPVGLVGVSALLNRHLAASYWTFAEYAFFFLIFGLSWARHAEVCVRVVVRFAPPAKPAMTGRWETGHNIQGGKRGRTAIGTHCTGTGLNPDGWVGRRVDGWTGGWVDGWLGGWMDGWTGGWWVGGWTGGWRERWMGGGRNGWMDGWVGG